MKKMRGVDFVVSSREVSILDEAKALVHGDRQRAYGHPAQNFADIAALWQVALGQRVTAEQVALCLVLLKLAREAHTHKRDNLVDAAGYLEALQMTLEQGIGGDDDDEKVGGTD